MFLDPLGPNWLRHTIYGGTKKYVFLYAVLSWSKILAAKIECDDMFGVKQIFLCKQRPIKHN